MNGGGTLIITGHRFEVGDPNHPGYPLAEFHKIVDGIEALRVDVLTLSELDRRSGVPVPRSVNLSQVRYGQIVPVIADMQRRGHASLLDELRSLVT
ncbi:hypothetical protein GCM10009810_16840 [Nostocoides vanveenii]|uniref:Uncharacterized protein n=2 Tax=Nostocoides vanveenii TaxID=330835 RepID=A0ABP4WM55_9MICO